MTTHRAVETLTEPSQSASQLERLLSLCRLRDTSYGADVFSTKMKLKCPPWARGAYGGQIIALALLAAYETVPAAFVVHSIHSHFLTPASIEMSMIYVVERTHTGKSFVTRTIHARQQDRLVLSATASFSRDRNSRREVLVHAVPMPSGELLPDDRPLPLRQSAAGQAGDGQPCDCVRSRIENKGLPSERRLRQWIRARGRIGDRPLKVRDCSGSIFDPDATITATGATCNDQDNNRRAHVAALAYMSDNYFVGTAFRVHNASRFSNRPSQHLMPISSKAVISPSNAGVARDTEDLHQYFKALAREEIDDNINTPKNVKHVEMMVTLNHTIFFHNPREFRADEWMLAEMESPWAGDERAVVLQRIWSHQGTLVATCIQEGVLRLLQHNHKSRL